jgi:hypothetical protein
MGDAPRECGQHGAASTTRRAPRGSKAKGYGTYRTREEAAVVRAKYVAEKNEAFAENKMLGYEENGEMSSQSGTKRGRVYRRFIYVGERQSYLESDWKRSDAHDSGVEPHCWYS